MTLDLTQTELPEPSLPQNFFWTPWDNLLVSEHAHILHAAFCNDLDGRIFPTYRQYEACEYLIRSSSSSESFAPEGTWLIGRELEPTNYQMIKVGRPSEFCAAIQCMRLSEKTCEIQNVSTSPQYRRLGLGRALILKALRSLTWKGLLRATLEVTAENSAAIRLYSSLGFQPTKLIFSESFVEVGPTAEFWKETSRKVDSIDASR